MDGQGTSRFFPAYLGKSSGTTWQWTSIAVMRRPRSRGRMPVERPILESGSLHRLGDEMALSHVAAEALQQVPVGARLDAFGDRLQLELLRHVEARGEDHLAGFLVVRAHHERLVDLQFGERDARELLHGRVAGAVVVDREA